MWVTGVRPAGEVISQVGPRRYLHSGPPLSHQELPGATRGAVVGALLWEGEARTPEEAEAMLAAGEVALTPAQEASAGGAVAGVISPGMPVVVAESSRGTRAFSPLNEGPGRALRFGNSDERVLRRLTWLRETLAPLLNAALAEEPICLTELQAEGLRRGDECHNRGVATSALLLLRLTAAVYRAAPSLAEAEAVLADARANPHFFVPFSIAAAKALVDAAHGVSGSPVVTASGGERGAPRHPRQRTGRPLVHRTRAARPAQAARGLHTGGGRSPPLATRC